MDHIPFWNWPATANGAGYGCGTKEIIDFMADLHPSKYTKPYAWMDSDFLETMFEPISMNVTNSRTEYAFWALWSAPLLVATDPADLSDEKKAILMNEEVRAIHQDPLFIAGERVYNATNGAQLWHRPLQNEDKVIILFNSGNFDAISIEVSWSEIGWEDGDVVSVRDLWGKQDLGTFTGSYKSPMIPVHDHLMLRLNRKW